MNAIELSDTGKRYVKYEDAPLLVTRALRPGARSRRSTLWALRHVQLAVRTGESVGVLGRNGSGKTTLLRLLAGVTGPTEGVVRVQGRVAPLISVGVGFHPELTGRENVYVNGTILGLRKGEIDRRFDEIVAFAEIEAFIDTPVKFYSSGMFVRLGFAAAVAAQPDVLLVDEVLAVGDVAFQLKCYRRMREIQSAGSTIIVVSHNLGAIRNLCPRSIVVHEGSIRIDGPTDDALSTYHELLSHRGTGDGTGGAAERDGVRDTPVAAIERFEMLGPDGRPTAHAEAGEEVTFAADVVFHRAVEDPVFGMALTTDDGVHVYGDSSPWRGAEDYRPRAVPAGSRLRFGARVKLSLATGSYTAHVGLQGHDLTTQLVRNTPTLLFYVTGRGQVDGIADLCAGFSVEALSSAGDPAGDEPGPPHGGPPSGR
ncbi:MAG: ABC transporter ATP-binding protein [Acidimicrobiales bacterium]